MFGLEFAAFMGQHLQSKLASMDKIIRIGFTVEEQLKIVEESSPDSLVLIFSMEGGFFYFSEKVIAALKKKESKLSSLRLSILQSLSEVQTKLSFVERSTKTPKGGLLSYT